MSYKTKLKDCFSNGRNATLILLFMWACYGIIKITFLTLIAKVITVDAAIFLEGLLSLSRGLLYNNAIQHIQLFGLAHYAVDSNPVISGFVFHQNYIMYVLVPFYYLFPHLLLLQLTPVFIIGLSSWIFFLIADRKLQDTRMAFFCFCTFLIIPSIVRSTLGFIPDTFGILFLTLYFYLLMNNKERLAFLSLVFLALCRENYFMIIAGLGIYAMIYKKQRRFGAAVLLLGVIHFFLGYLVVPGILSPGGNGPITALHLFRHFGGSMTEIAKNIVLHPLDTIIYMFRKDSLIYFLCVFSPFIFLSWKNPLNLIVIPPLMINSLSGAPYAINLNTHHTFILMPIIFFAWLEELGNVSRNRNIWVGTAAFLCLVFLIVFQTFNTPLSSLNILNRSISTNGAYWEEMLAHGRNVDTLLKKIPEKSNLAIDIRAATEFFYSISPKRKTTVYPRGVKEAQYLIRYESTANSSGAKKQIGPLAKEAIQEDIKYFSKNSRLWERIFIYDLSKTEKISLWRRKYL